MTSYDEMKAQGSFAEASRSATKEERADEMKASVQRTNARMRENWKHASELFPEATEERWLPILAGAVGRLSYRNRKGRRSRVDRAAVVAQVRAWGYPADELSEGSE